jgi:hypothetical protein
VGDWKEWVQFPSGIQSNQIAFHVSAAPVSPTTLTSVGITGYFGSVDDPTYSWIDGYVTGTGFSPSVNAYTFKNSAGSPVEFGAFENPGSLVSGNTIFNGTLHFRTDLPSGTYYVTSNPSATVIEPSNSLPFVVLWPPAIETGMLPGAEGIGTVGTAYKTPQNNLGQKLDASSFSGPVTFSATGLSGSGLSLDPNSGLISGTPTTAGNYNVTATATSGSQTASISFVIAITPNGVGTNIVTPDPSYPYATLEYLSPSVARPGDTVVITGTKFNSTANQNVVGFRNSSNAVVGTTVATASTGSSLTFVVPASLPFGNYQVSVGIDPVVSRPSANSLPLTVGTVTVIAQTPLTVVAGTGGPGVVTAPGGVVLPNSPYAQSQTTINEQSLLNYEAAHPLMPLTPPQISNNPANNPAVLLVAPTASLTANGSTMLTVAPGTVINYAWASNGATATSTYYVIGSPDTCPDNHGSAGPFPWVASIPNGTMSGTVQSCQAGHTYDIMFTATSAAGVKASATIFVTVKGSEGSNPPPPSAAVASITGVQGYDPATGAYTDGTVSVGDYMILYGNFGALGNTVSVNGNALPASDITYQGLSGNADSSAPNQINITLSASSPNPNPILSWLNSGAGNSVTVTTSGGATTAPASFTLSAEAPPSGGTPPANPPGSGFPKIVTANTAMNVRSSPSVSASIVGTLAVGIQFTATDEVSGDSVSGNNMWWVRSAGDYVWSGGTDVSSSNIPPAIPPAATCTKTVTGSDGAPICVAGPAADGCVASLANCSGSTPDCFYNTNGVPSCVPSSDIPPASGSDNALICTCMGGTQASCSMNGSEVPVPSDFTCTGSGNNALICTCMNYTQPSCSMNGSPVPVPSDFSCFGGSTESCSPGQNQACESSANSCGMMNPGAETCSSNGEWGNCSEPSPSDGICASECQNHPDYGDCPTYIKCQADPAADGCANASNKTSNGTCTPGEVQNSDACESTANACGMTTAGTETCGSDGKWGACSAATSPSDSACSSYCAESDNSDDPGCQTFSATSGGTVSVCAVNPDDPDCIGFCEENPYADGCTTGSTVTGGGGTENGVGSSDGGGGCSEPDCSDVWARMMDID